ncbi:hypothetical protein [Pontimicrobium sp. SW4]|uniref:Uncharacterized protein n=1 Tax=Pontimicrobium sp. SW4 TaxID=3153519 RepID=A0AAU7BU70_9FLAO
MNRLILLLVAFIAFNANAISGEIPIDTKKNYKTLKEINLEIALFESDINLSLFEVYEIEEEVHFDFDPKQYLPEDFNPLEGKNDIDWSSIELVEVEEEVELEFDTSKYLPSGFNPYKGINCEKEDVVVCLY